MSIEIKKALYPKSRQDFLRDNCLQCRKEEGGKTVYDENSCIDEITYEPLIENQKSYVLVPQTQKNKINKCYLPTTLQNLYEKSKETSQYVSRFADPLTSTPYKPLEKWDTSTKSKEKLRMFNEKNRLELEKNKHEMVEKFSDILTTQEQERRAINDRQNMIQNMSQDERNAFVLMDQFDARNNPDPDPLRPLVPLTGPTFHALMPTQQLHTRTFPTLNVIMPALSPTPVLVPNQQYDQNKEMINMYLSMFEDPQYMANLPKVYAQGNRSFLIRQNGTVEMWGESWDKNANDRRARPRTDLVNAHEHYPGTSKSISAGRDFILFLQPHQGKVLYVKNDTFGINPDPVRDLGDDFFQIASNDTFSLGLKLDGSISCWGRNFYGEAPPAGINGQFTAVAAGLNHGLAIRFASASIHCWGKNDFNQAPPEGIPGNFISVSAGYRHSVALRNDGTIMCWGQNTHGQAPPTIEGEFEDIASGWEHNIAIRTDGTLFFWGRNQYNQAPRGAIEGRFISIAAGTNHSVALRADGQVMCWGNNSYGQAPPHV